MKCKKFLTIMLVAFLVITSVSAVASARFSIFANNDQNTIIFGDTGTINLKPFGKTIFIQGKEGVEIGNITYKDYRVVNSNEVYEKLKVEEGMEVSFTASVLPIFTLFSNFASSFFSKFVKYLPINIIDIEKIPEQPIFRFNLKIKHEYSIEDDPIHLKAIIENMGGQQVKLCDIGFEFGTLDLLIFTKGEANDPIHYIGPKNKIPRIITLNPREALINGINLKEYVDEGLFARVDGETPYVFKFVPGNYSIQGVYTSFYPNISESNKDLWKGSLETQKYDFEITE